MHSQRQEVFKVTRVRRQRTTLPCKNWGDAWDWCPSNQTRHSHYGWVWGDKPQTLTPRAWAHSHSNTADVSAWIQGHEPGKHHHEPLGDKVQDGWKEGVQILTVLLFLVSSLLTKYVVWEAHSYLPNSNLILVTFQRKTRKEILV